MCIHVDPDMDRYGNVVIFFVETFVRSMDSVIFASSPNPSVFSNIACKLMILSCAASLCVSSMIMMSFDERSKPKSKHSARHT
jgi:hypothetical protein